MDTFRDLSAHVLCVALCGPTPGSLVPLLANASSSQGAVSLVVQPALKATQRTHVCSEGSPAVDLPSSILFSDSQVSRSACLMTTQLICKLLRSREAAAAVDVRAWPPILDTGQSSSSLGTVPSLLSR